MSKFKTWKTYSIFISSTFADMQAERDHLKNFVLPKVKEELRKKRIKLEIVDLRWGLDTTSIEQEDEREATVLKVCLDEIKRCKPFFICLLGDRYGWIPPEKRMDNATIGMDYISNHKGKSVTALEIEFGVLASKDQLVRSVFYLRNTLDYSKFTPEKAAMFSDAHNPSLSKKEKKERGKALEKLKSSITSHFDNKEIKDKVKIYSVNWEAQKEKVVNLEAWGDMVYEDIINDCIAHAKYTKTSAPKNWQEKELALLDSFVENHTTTFCGRKKLLKELKEHLLLKDPNNWGLILTGESGSGKSAVFSMINSIMQQEDCFILSHSAGLSAKSRNILELLQIWNKQLSDFLGIEYDEYKPEEKVGLSDILSKNMEGDEHDKSKPEIEKIQEKFKELLFAVAEKKQVVLLLDALDRFEPTERAKYMTWLPTTMPGNIRMLCTAITGTEKKAIEYHTEILVKSIDFFTLEEAKLMLNMLCNLQHKSIPIKVEKVILEKKRDDGLHATSSPLWLSLAINILMAMDNDDFEKMKQLEGRGDEVIVDYMETLVNDFPALPGSLFLSLLTKAASVFGENFTGKIFNYIACSRDGLRESDLEKLIPKTKDENWDALLFANLRRWFNKHLREEGEDKQWNLVHSILRNSLLEEIKKKALRNIHNSIASHLLSLPAEDELKVNETMYHLMEAGNTKKALDYYISELTDEELNGATTVLAEAVSTRDKGIDWVLSLIETASNDTEKIWKLAPLTIYSLNDALLVEGNLDERGVIFERLKTTLEELNTNFESNIYHGNIFRTLLEKIGEIYQLTGEYNISLDCYFITNKLARNLYAKEPENKNLKNGLAISYSKLGEIHLLMDKFQESLTFFNSRIKLGIELYNNNPNNENIKNGLAVAYSKLGDAYLALDNLNTAKENYKEDFKLTKELYDENPQNEEHKNNLAFSYGKLGLVDMMMGDLNKALNYFIERKKLSQELHNNNPKNENLKNGLAISLERLGEVYQKLNNPDEAYDNFQKRKTIAKQLHESNPKNEYFKTGYALSYDNFGGLYEQYGQLDEALKYYNDSYILYKRFYDESPENKYFKQSYADSCRKLGIVYLKLGQKNPQHLDNAILCFQNNNALAKNIMNDNPDNGDTQNYYALSFYQLGEANQAKNQLDDALTCFINTNILSGAILENYPKNNNYIKNIALSNMKIGEIYMARQERKLAKQHFIKSNDLTKILYDSNPKNINYQKELNESYEKIINYYKDNGEVKVVLPFSILKNELAIELFVANKNNGELYNSLGLSHHELGMDYYVLQQFEESKVHFTKAFNIFEQFYNFTKQDKYKQSMTESQNMLNLLHDFDT